MPKEMWFLVFTFLHDLDFAACAPAAPAGGTREDVCK